MPKTPRPTPQAQAAFQLYVGVDISAKTFTASFYQPHTGPEPSRSVSYRQGLDEGGQFDELVERLARFEVAPAQVLVVMEATANYHLSLAIYLAGLGYGVAVLNPKAVANYFKSRLVRTKTDAVDARNLARLAYDQQPSRWTPPSDLYHELHQRLVLRQQFVELTTQAKNQLHALKANPKALPTLVSQLEKTISYLQQQSQDLTNQLEKIVEQPSEQTWIESIKLLRTIDGIGLLTACMLVTVYHNFANCPSPEAAAQYCGLAPNERSSGTSVRRYQAVGQTGQAMLRRLLYMAALSAVRKNGFLRAYYVRLVEVEKKARKVALIAVARKLLHIAYAIVRSRKPFERAVYEQRWQKRQQPKTQVA